MANSAKFSYRSFEFQAKTTPMKTTALLTALTAACSQVLFAAPVDLPTVAPKTPENPAEVPNVNQLQVFPKNIARQHLGANLFLFDEKAQRYVATEAAAAWLDEDPVTGWSVLPGKQHYMLQFTEPQIITNFGLSAKTNNGTLSLSLADQPAAPGDASWNLVARNVAIESLNNKHFKGALNRTAKCVLIETDIADPSAIYSLYVYGDKAAASESIQPRQQPVDVHALGEFVNQQTAFNVAGLYANGRVTYSNSPGSNITWQRAIDDNPESTVPVAPSSSEAGLVVRFGGPQPVTRLSVQGDQAAKGTLDVFLLSQAPDAGQTVGLEGITPSVSLKFDGTTARVSADIEETNSVAMVMRWKPEGSDAAFALHDLSAFSNISLTDHEVVVAPDAIAAIDDTMKKGTGGEGKDSKEVIAEGPSGKEGKAPIGEGPTDEKPPGIASGPGGFTPGGLGFPPRIQRNPVSQ